MIEVKPFILRIVSIFLLIAVCFLLQTSVFIHFELASVGPNLLIALTSLFGFMRGQKEGAIIGFSCGLLNDLFFGSYFGAFALIYMLCGYLNGFFRKLLYGDDIKLPLLLVSISDIIYGFAVFVFMFLSRSKTNLGFYVGSVILPEMVYTLIVSFLLYFVVFKLNQWLEKKEKRSDRLVR
jgi:rod shape-determining protein MreD